MFLSKMSRNNNDWVVANNIIPKPHPRDDICIVYYLCGCVKMEDTVRQLVKDMAPFGCDRVVVVTGLAKMST